MMKDFLLGPQRSSVVSSHPGRFPILSQNRRSKKRLRVLVFSSKGGGTGCALRALYIARAFQKKGHQARFVKPIPSLPLWFDMVLSTFYYLALSLFQRSDAVMAVKPYPTVVPALWVQRLKGARVVMDVDDLDYGYSRGWFRDFHGWLQKPWPARADIVTFHNPELRKPLLDFFRVPSARLIQLPQGVDTELFHPGPPDPSGLPPAAAALARGPHKSPLLAFTAHLNVACDLDPVLESFRILLRSIPRARLLVAGGGPDEGRFRQKTRELGVAESVDFTGPVTPVQVADCLRACDAALVYYRDIPVNRHRASMKLREALACGRKVVATRVGEAAHWKKAVFLSAPDPASFAEALLAALKAKKRVQSGVQLMKQWDWTRCVETLEKNLLKGTS